MPEGPEIESLVRKLRRVWPKNAKVIEHIYSGKMGRISNKLIGSIAKPPIRCGKVILIPLIPKSGASKICAIRSGMSGFVTLGPRAKNKHCHLQWKFNSNLWLSFIDPRRFGSFRVYNASDLDDFFGTTGTSVLLSVGPDPMVDLPWIERGVRRGNLLWRMLQCRGPKSTLKSTLMDGAFLAGIGNIYASEICFDAGIHPLRLCNSINRVEAGLIAKAANEILTTATLCGGSRIHSWKGTSDDSGYAKYLCVYGKEKLPCPKCQQLITKIIDQGRSTFFCSKCQT